ncbi:MAG: undecaprenyl-diphosphatase, partial [Kordiimonadaceae bacterium]|nr:undecaprenyl-diphosphatase [Kordiimonadaceae bacterium]
MTGIQLIILALVQGITEFLPISSSGHLVLIPALTGWPDQGLFIDVALHVGTLAAVLIYFRTEAKGLVLAAAATFGIAPARRAIEGTLYHQLFWGLIIGTIPMVIVGGIVVALPFITEQLLGVRYEPMDSLRTAEVIASTSII